MFKTNQTNTAAYCLQLQTDASVFPLDHRHNLQLVIDFCRVMREQCRWTRGKLIPSQARFTGLRILNVITVSVQFSFRCVIHCDKDTPHADRQGESLLRVARA